MSKFRVFKQYSEPLEESLFSIKAGLAREYCQAGELVLDLEATDELIGMHALSLINTIFQANP